MRQPTVAAQVIPAGGKMANCHFQKFLPVVIKFSTTNLYYFGDIKERKGYITKKREVQGRDCLASALRSVNGICICEAGVKCIKNLE